MQEPIRIGDMVVQPGKRLTLDLPIAHLYTHAEMTMPVHVIHGRKSGPKLFISAALHGDEINGVEIIRRVLQRKLLGRIHGTLIAIPIVNIYGFVHRSRYLPDRRDLNRAFPGSNKGSLASRLARLFLDEIVSQCSHGIDLHTASNHRSNLPQIRACLDNPETERLSRAFGAPVVIDSRLRDGSLREAGDEMGIPMLLYEAGEALRFNEWAVQTGTRGIMAVMREIDMLPRDPRHKPPPEPMIAHSTAWVRAPISGILSTGARLGTRVEKGDRLGIVADPFGENQQEVFSPQSGIIIGNLNLPLIHEGDALFHIASVEETDQAESALQSFEVGLDVDEIDLTTALR